MQLTSFKNYDSMTKFYNYQLYLSNVDKSIAKNFNEPVYERQLFGVKTLKEFKTNKQFIENKFSKMPEASKYKFENLIEFSNNNPQCFNTTSKECELFFKFLKI